MWTCTRAPLSTLGVSSPAAGVSQGASKWTSLLVRVRPVQRVVAGAASSLRVLAAWSLIGAPLMFSTRGICSTGRICSTRTSRVRPSSRWLIWAATAAWQGLDGLKAFRLDGGGEVVGLVAGGEGAGAGAVGGDVDLVEAEVGEEVVGVLELGVGFAGEADDDVGADADLRHAGADLGDAVAEVDDGVAAAHLREEGVVAGLDGEGEGFADLGKGGHALQDAVRHVGGVGGEGADAVEAGEVVQGGHEVEEIGVGGSGGLRCVGVGVGLCRRPRRFGRGA